MLTRRHVLVRDIETRSAVDLGDVGAHIYATHPSTVIRCVGYCLDDGPVKIWHPGDPVPKEYRAATTWVAHNAAFDYAIEQHILGPRYGFPIAKIEQQVCTMAMCHAMALPGKLERAAKALNLENQKDANGARVQLQMSKPRKARKGEDKNGIYYIDDPEKHAQSDDSCMKDVAATRELYQILPELSPEEYHTWLLDQRINNNGFYLDQKLGESMRAIAAEMNPRINDELNKITNGQITAFTQVARITKWVKHHIGETTLNKDVIEELFDKHKHLPKHVRRVLELRLLGAQAAVAKVDALLQRRCDDGRVRGSFVYHAAGPGRWSSRGAQVHNLKRPQTEDLERAIKIMGTGDLKLALREYANPLSVIGDCIRGMIIAAPGHTLIGGDFSGIEARVTAWIAKDEDKLDIFRAYDEGRGPDPYIIAAGNIFDIDPNQLAADCKLKKPLAIEQRQAGKASELAFGFQGGVNAYRKFAPNTTLTDAQIEEIKTKWRAAHPKIVSLWSNLNNAIEKAVDFNVTKDDPEIVRDRIKVWCEGDEWTFMRIELPSGRYLAYPHPRYGRSSPKGKKSRFVTFGTQWGAEGVCFKDNASGAWDDVRMYGGLATENVVQAIARDLLRDAMLRVKAAGYEIVTHVHDEIVIEVPKKDAERIKPIFTKLMQQSPSWAAGLPIRVNSWISQRYTK